MIAALSLFFAFQLAPELRQRVDAGLKAKAAGDLNGAVREFRRVTELAPNLAASHMNLGAVYFEQQDYSDASASLQKALELDAALPGAHAMLGAALLAQGYAAASIPHLEKAQADDLLGVALLETNRAREALDRLESALLKRPGDPDLLYYLSEAHGRLAKQAFDRLQEKSPDSPRAHQILGEGMAAAGNRDSAEQHFRAALRSRPRMRDIHFALGELYLASGDDDKAEKEFRAEAELAPGSAAAAYRLGSLLLNHGRLAEAIAELKHANELQAGMPETMLALAKALNASGDPKAALDYLLQVLKAEQSTELAATAHFQLAQVYRKLGRSADAESETKLFQELRGRR